MHPQGGKRILFDVALEQDPLRLLLRAKGKDRWFVPDPSKAGDLEKLRERSLLKEFEEYRTTTQKRLRVLRLEAVRAGFKRPGRPATTPRSSRWRTRSQKTSSTKTRNSSGGMIWQ